MSNYETLAVSWTTQLDPDVFRATAVDWEASLHVNPDSDQRPLLRRKVWIRDGDNVVHDYDAGDEIPAWVPRPPNGWDASLQAYLGPGWDATLPTREGLPPGT